MITMTIISASSTITLPFVSKPRHLVNTRLYFACSHSLWALFPGDCMQCCSVSEFEATALKWLLNLRRENSFGIIDVWRRTQNCYFNVGVGKPFASVTYRRHRIALPELNAPKRSKPEKTKEKLNRYTHTIPTHNASQSHKNAKVFSCRKSLCAAQAKMGDSMC